MKKIINHKIRNIAVTIFLICAFPVLIFSQDKPTQNTDRCVVTYAQGFTYKTNRLGSFTTIIEEDRATLRSYKIPGTKLFLLAYALYTDDSMDRIISKDARVNINSMEMTLIVATKSPRQLQKYFKRSPKLYNQFILNMTMSEYGPHLIGKEKEEDDGIEFEVGVVTSISRIHGKQFFFQMECRKHTRVEY